MADPFTFGSEIKLSLLRTARIAGFARPRHNELATKFVEMRATRRPEFS